MKKTVPTASHWGAYRAVVVDGSIVDLLPFEHDPDPSAIGQSMADSVTHKCRVTTPAIRRSWLDNGPGSNTASRGAEPFVSVDWQTALDFVAGEIRRVGRTYGPETLYAGSYGWASAGRFHHAQSQMRRFLNMAGGHTNSVNTYSFGAAEVIIPHVTGSFYEIFLNPTTWATIARHSDLVVSFGGFAPKNTQINGGGLGVHGTRQSLEECRKNGVSFVYLGPTQHDMPENLKAQWLQPRPTTDTAIMLALAYVLVSENLHDEAFLTTHCTGFDRFKPYLLGTDGHEPKTPEWAEHISGIPASEIVSLARRMAKGRTFITASWSLQRQEHGEQPYWMVVTLAAILGQIGLPGGGFGLGHAATGTVGNAWDHIVRPAALPVPENPVKTIIPVARIADMLLNPGQKYDYNGQQMSYPEISMIYWCGGNPFHHHQDLNKLLRAWQKPETIVVHEPWWTPTALHADIVLPCTTTLERNDFAMGHGDPWLMAMHQAVPPHARARNEYDIFSDLAERLGFREAFTENRTEMDWLRHMWQITINRASQHDMELPGFDEFWAAGTWELPPFENPGILYHDFRRDPGKYALSTPSGRIEIFSETVAGFGYVDCPGHPVWLEPQEYLGSETAQSYPLHLVSNQPKDKLHSQLDFGITSLKNKTDGRTQVRMAPEDAQKRGIETGDTVRLFNDRGACLASLIIDEGVQPGVVIMPTGAWYTSAEPGKPDALELAGNPNVLTRDVGTSSLAQGSTAHSCLIEIEKYTQTAPLPDAYSGPVILPM